MDPFFSGKFDDVWAARDPYRLHILILFGYICDFTFWCFAVFALVYVVLPLRQVLVPLGGVR